MDSQTASVPFPMSTPSEALVRLFHLVQMLTKSNETLVVLTQKLNERIDILEAKLAHECLRCGRNGHWATACYAQTHTTGQPLEVDDSEYNSE